MSDTSCYPLTPVESSTIDAIGHNDLGRLIVRFKSGAEWAYDDVPFSVYNDLLHAESKGAYFANQIKRHIALYPREKLSDTPINPAIPATTAVNEYTILQDRVAALERHLVVVLARLARHDQHAPGGALPVAEWPS